MKNLQIYQLDNQIRNLISNSDLTISDYYLILKNIYSEIENLYLKQVENEAKEINKTNAECIKLDNE